jgi:hypothetical protein
MFFESFPPPPPHPLPPLPPPPLPPPSPFTSNLIFPQICLAADPTTTLELQGRSGLQRCANTLQTCLRKLHTHFTSHIFLEHLALHRTLFYQHVTSLTLSCAVAAQRQHPRDFCSRREASCRCGGWSSELFNWRLIMFFFVTLRLCFYQQPILLSSAHNVLFHFYSCV